MRQKFNIELLNQIPIDEVCERLGARYVRGTRGYAKTFAMHCFCGMHEHGDKNPSLVIWKDKNICKCMVNPIIKGNPISLVENILFGGDFKQACIWLHEQFNIPYIEDFSDEEREYARKVAQKKVTFKKIDKKDKKIICLDKELKKSFKRIDISKYLPKYSKMNKAQKLKLIYSFIYRYSLDTNHKHKFEYYKNRGIKNKDHLKDIGYLDNEDIPFLMGKLLENFEVDDLVEVKIINGADHSKRPLEFKYISQEGFLVVPNGFELSNDLVNGLMLRPTKRFDFQKAKEFQVSVPEVALPIPYGLTRKRLKDDIFFITEGHIDALSLKEMIGDVSVIAVPGVHNIKKEWLCLLKNKKVYIVFDMDEAGRNAALQLKDELKECTFLVEILQWNRKFKDLNDLLKSEERGVFDNLL